MTFNPIGQRRRYSLGANSMLGKYYWQESMLFAKAMTTFHN